MKTPEGRDSAFLFAGSPITRMMLGIKYVLNTYVLNE